MVGDPSKGRALLVLEDMELAKRFEHALERREYAVSNRRTSAELGDWESDHEGVSVVVLEWSHPSRARVIAALAVHPPRALLGVVEAAGGAAAVDAALQAGVTDLLIVPAGDADLLGCLAQLDHRIRAAAAPGGVEWLRHVVAQTQDGVWTLDDAGRTTFMNPGMLAMLGRRESEVLGEPIETFMAPATARSLGYQLVARTGTRGQYDVALLRANGSKLHALVSVSTLPRSGGAIALVTDLSPRRALEETLQRLSRALGGTSDGVIITNRDGVIEYANPALEAMTGHNLRDLLGKTPRVFRGDDQDPTFYAQFWEKLRSEGAWKGVFKNRRRDGIAIFMEQTITSLRDDDGEITHFVSISRDVTDRVGVERATEEHQRNLAAALGDVGGGVIATDVELCVLWMNATAEALTGWSVREAIGRPIEEVFLVRAGVGGAGVVRALHDGLLTALPLDAVLVSRDGTERPVADSVAFIRDRSGGAGGVVLVFRDATEEKRAKAALERSEANFRTLIQASPDFVVVHREGRIVYANPVACAALGYLLAEVIGRPVLDYVDPEDHGPMRVRIDKGRAGHALPARETRLVRQDGSLVDVEVQAVPVEFDGERSVLTLARDLTERKKLEAQFLHAQRMEAVGRLAAGVAHDFNNILSVILATTEFVVEELGDETPVLGDLEEIRQAGHRAAALTRQLLSFTSKESAQPRAVDLCSVVIELRKLLQRALGEDIDILLRLSPDTGLIRADIGQLEQIIVNLAVNARDAMPNGGKLTIETSSVSLRDDHIGAPPDLRPGWYGVIAVSDTGHGIAPSLLGRIFEPFFTTKGPGKGTGLGLSSVFGIAKQSGGAVSVVSKPGSGTTFKIYIPRFDGVDERPTQHPPSSHPPTRNARILLIEDDAFVRGVVRRILVAHGHDLVEADGPQAALDEVEKDAASFDLILTDIVMPGMDGPSLVGKLRALWEARGSETHGRPLPVIYMSGYTEHAAIRNGALEPGESFIPKPFTAHELLASVRRALVG